MPILVVAAIIPIFALCTFIYMKDKNREPGGLLAGIFLLGFIAVFPVLVCELIFGAVFPMDTKAGFILIFLNVLFGVALIEEFFKWVVILILGFNSKEFDEVYDVIVYSVFSSLGFACFENICYVLQNGLGNALLRAVLAVPGHTCFAISMGYFLSKAKVNQISGNKGLRNKNLVLSMVVPVILHTFYDALLFNMSGTESMLMIIPFLIFYIGMVVICFLTVDKVAKVQQNLTTNIQNGNIIRNDQGYIQYNYGNVVPSVPQKDQIEVLGDTQTTMPPVQPKKELNFCPICGRPANGKNFCSNCGFRLK
jgi:RsiW-degrading membrane proteinase PrsW (M82 family)